MFGFPQNKVKYYSSVENNYLSAATHTTVVSSEWDALFLIHHILQILDGPSEWHPLNGTRRLPSVLIKVQLNIYINYNLLLTLVDGLILSLTF